jgi:hypothetical protein
VDHRCTQPCPQNSVTDWTEHMMRMAFCTGKSRRYLGRSFGNYCPLPGRAFCCGTGCLLRVTLRLVNAFINTLCSAHHSTKEVSSIYAARQSDERTFTFRKTGLTSHRLDIWMWLSLESRECQVASIVYSNYPRFVAHLIHL